MCVECGCEPGPSAEVTSTATAGLGERVRLVGIELPAEGELVRVEADGVSVALARVGGELLAVDDECTHAACSLSDGEIEGTSIVCACHFGRFDLRSGQVLDGPPERPVRTWRATYRDGALELEL